ncbi:MAG: type VI secretion system tube protein TssD [Limnohabitans sp.]|nr:type VI secretion system tube protein TssD [Limnohabitans sp.]
MSVVAKLFVDNKEYDIKYLKISIYQETDHRNLPVGNPLGGYFDIQVEAGKENIFIDWMLQHNGVKDVKIVIPSRFAGGKSRVIELKDTYCVSYNDTFTSTTSEPMSTTFRLSPGGIYNNGVLAEGIKKHWHDEKPVEQLKPLEDDKDEEKKVILSFKPANANDVKNGKFGFDDYKSELKKYYTGKSYASFENEYKPIQVYGEKYFPSWLSIRKGQTITLEITESKRKNYPLFNEIKFADTPDFTFEPADLKNAKQVKITCNNEGNTAQLKVEGDGVVAGALNVFYPKPREVKLHWVVVNYNKGDISTIKQTVNDSDTLKTYLKKAFNPTLIDINIVNENEEILDITSPVTNPDEKGTIEGLSNYFTNGSKNNITQDRDLKLEFLHYLHQLHLKRQKIAQTNEVYLYLTNLKSETTTESATSSDYEDTAYGNGATYKNYSIMFLGNTNKKPEVEIPHEIMHALDLEHTFNPNNKHIFEIGKTKNYMDYDNTKESLWVWQWQLLH